MSDRVCNLGRWEADLAQRNVLYAGFQYGTSPTLSVFFFFLCGALNSSSNLSSPEKLSTVHCPTGFPRERLLSAVKTTTTEEKNKAPEIGAAQYNLL